MFVMADGAYVTGPAIFDDRFERRDGVWRMSYRRVDVNHLAEIKGAVVTLSPGSAST